ncbi:hypothetical protein F5882DRAFT_386609 [Hyaloscypha sp. PMI_1271]|nr:hypothetical protein F5882DRAFT_386609 [Hyaloscypha sp. PMI_1271]
MSIIPLPPIVYGPIYPITPVLHVSGVFKDWTIIVTSWSSAGARNLAQFPYIKPDTPLGDQWIPLSDLPHEDEYIIVEQYHVDSEHTTSSGPSPEKAVQVLHLPQPELPAPIVGAPLHTCSCCIGVEGLIPGAWINVEIDGGPLLLHKQILHGTSDIFVLDENISLPEGAFLNVWQNVPGTDKVQVLESPKVSSGPIQNLKLIQPLRPVFYCGNPSVCTNEVCLRNMLPGVEVRVDAPNGWFTADITDQETWDFQGYFDNPITGGPPNALVSTQFLARCHLSSLPSQSAPLSQPNHFDTPELEMPICDDQEKIWLHKLVPGAQLRVTRLVGAKSGHPTNTGDPSQTRELKIPNTDWLFNIPRDWALTDPNGEVSFQFSQYGIDGCGIKSGTSDPQYVIASTLAAGVQAPTPHLLPDPAYYCSDTLLVDQVTIGTELQIIQTDGQTLTDWIPVKATSVSIALPKRLTKLPKGVGLQAIQRGCKADRSSNIIKVDAFPMDHLPDPVLPPSNPPHPLDKFVYAEELIPGARAYVMVDGSRYDSSGTLWSREQIIISEKQNIILQSPLVWKSHVFVVQYLCGGKDSSSISLPGVLVDKARLSINPTPSPPFVKGSPIRFQIHCHDTITSVKDLGPKWGPITVEGIPPSTCFCGSCFVTLNIAATDARSSILLTLAETDVNYETKYPVALSNPPPPTFDLKLTAGQAVFSTIIPLVSTNQNTDVTCTGIKWTITPQWAPTASITANGIIDTNTNLVTYSHAFNRPPAGTASANARVSITGTITYDIEGRAFTAQLSGLREVNPTGASCVGWRISFHFAASGVLDVYQFVWDGKSPGPTMDPPVLDPEGFSC